MPGGYAALYSLATVLGMVIASIRSAANYFAVFNYNGACFYSIVKRIEARVLARLNHERIVCINVLEDTANGKVRIFNSRHSDNVS